MKAYSQIAMRIAGLVVFAAVLAGCCSCSSPSMRMLAPAPWEMDGDGAGSAHNPTGDSAVDGIDDIQRMVRRRQLLLARQRVVLGRQNLSKREYRRAIDQFTGAETVLREVSMSQPTVVRDLKYVRKLLATTYREYALQLIDKAKYKIERAKDELDISMLAPAEIYITRALAYDANLAADAKRLRKKIKALEFRIEIEIRTRPSEILKQLGNIEEEFRQKLVRRRMKWLDAQRAPHMQKKAFDSQTEVRIAELKLRYDALRQRAGRTYGAGVVETRLPEVRFQEFKLLATPSQGSLHEPQPTPEEMARWRAALTQSGVPKVPIDSPDYRLYRSEAAFLSGDGARAWSEFQAYRKSTKVLPSKVDQKLDRGFHAWLTNRHAAGRSSESQGEAQDLADRVAAWVGETKPAQAARQPFHRWRFGHSPALAIPMVKRKSSSGTPSGLSLDVDEIWILARMDEAKKANRPYVPRADMVARVPGIKHPVPLVLKHTAVKGRISAFAANVQVNQTFKNPYSQKIEATYVFPLPEDAAVTDFVMVIGKRRIRGIIREREEAERIYKEARDQGYRASMLTQERPNVFTQKVANIEPGKEIGVSIRYFSALKYSNGEFEFSLPLVVGPRVGTIENGDCPDPAPVGYSAPKKRSGHNVTLSLNIEAGVSIEDFGSPTHEITVKKINASRLNVEISRRDRIPNKDFVFRWKVAGKKLKTGFLTHADKHGKTFSLMLVPPAASAKLPVQPREMIFVVDCSRSMSGAPLNKMKETMRRCLQRLDASDSFQIIRSSEAAFLLGGGGIRATEKNVKRGLKFIDELRADGKPMMVEGIKGALDMPQDPKRLRIVSIMTDGYIGDETAILATIRKKLGGARVFSFGIGSSVNRYLIEAMAREGRGAAVILTPKESSLKPVMDFYERVRQPALVDVKIDWCGLEMVDLCPKPSRDILAGQPVVISGRYKGTLPKEITLSGVVGGKKVSYRLPLDRATGRDEGVRFVWARDKIRELTFTNVRKPSKDLQRELVRFSVAQKVLCGYTAFLAVDSSRKTDGELGISMNIPAEFPDGVGRDESVK